MTDDRLLTDDALAYMRKVLATYRAVPAMAIDTRTLILLLDEHDALRARIAALEAALRDVCEAAVVDYAGCSICDSVPGYEPGNFIHAPGCPVAAALALLADAQS